MFATVLLVLALVACGSPEPAPTPLPPPPARSKAKSKPPVRAKAKTGNMVPGKGKAKAPARGKAGMKRPPPVGGPGENKGFLVLEVSGAEAELKTDASVVLAWGEGEATKVHLGEVEGRCTSVAPQPVGPEGRQHTPLWTVSCDHMGTMTELYVLQVKTLLAVVRGGPAEGRPMAYKPVRRVPLRPGATLVRDDGTPPAVEEAVPSDPGAPPAPAPEAPAPEAPAAPAPAAPAPPAPATPEAPVP